jgi:hypothetical protein
MEASHYNYTCLDHYLTHDYDPLEVADKLRETRLALAELMAKEEFSSEWKIVCYRMLYDLEEIFRTLEKVQP